MHVHYGSHTTNEAFDQPQRFKRFSLPPLLLPLPPFRLTTLAEPS